LNILDTPNEERFDRLARIIQAYFNVPIVLVTMIEDDRQWFKSSVGMEDRNFPRDMAMCSYTILDSGILYVPDTTLDRRFKDQRLVIGEPHLRFYTGAPPTTPEGFRIGTLCIVDMQPRELSAKDLQVFREIADCVEHELFQPTEAAAMSHSHARYMNAVLDTAWDPIITIDAGGLVIRANQATERLFRIPAGSLDGGPIDRLMTDFDLEAFRSKVNGEGAGALGRPAGESIMAAEMIGRRGDGSTFPMEISINEIDGPGDRQFVAVVRDITEHRRQQNFLDAIIENIPHMVFVKDAEDLRYVRLNRAGEELHGIPAADFIGKNDFDFFPDDQAERFISMDREVLANRELAHVPEEPISMANKGDRILQTKKVGIYDDNGQPLYLLGISEDVTEKRLIETALATSLIRAEEANRIKSAFLTSVSHELRSPLNSVIGLSELLQLNVGNELSAEKVQSYARNIGALGQSLLSLINDILDFAKMGSGKFDLYEDAFQLGLEIANIRSAFQIKVAARHVSLSVGSLDRDYTVFGDNIRLRQVIYNLLDNAIKFAAKGNVELALRIEPRRDDEICLEIRVMDDGIGIPADRLEGVFVPFSQSDSSIARQYGGTGLGLAISRNLTQLMRGDLLVTSKMGEGSVIIATFIFKDLGHDGAVLPETQRPGRVEAIADLGLVVLAVDDLEVNLGVIESVAESLGCTVHKARGGRTAVNWYAHHHADEVVMDLHMPSMDGIETARQIQSLPGAKGEVPIYAWTADTTAHRHTLGDEVR
jgi:PAS domain S-box-containing protein